MAKILVIEDNPANMKLTEFLLARAGHEVHKAEDALGGIALARTQLPDLVLMDVQLPGMDGLTAIRQLRADPSTRAVKIIALTAFAMKGDEEKMWSAGCDGYIAKPFEYKVFLAKIEAVLRSADKPRTGPGRA